MSDTRLTLWPHQTAAIDAAHAARQRMDAGLWSMPTGSGKTVAFAGFARDCRLPTLVLVHRDELIRQACETFGTVWPDATVGVVQAERNELHADVVVASVPSLHAARLRTIPPDRFGLLIADEAHHAVADTWAAVLDHFNGADFILGVTATPERADGRGLADRFGREPIYSYPLRQCIEDGHLVRPVQYAIETDVQLDGVSYHHGDFAEGALSHAVNTPERNRIIVEAYQQYATGRRAIGFTVDVQHAHDLCAAFTTAGIQAAAVTGTTPRDERRQTLADFADGRLQVVTNCAVLTEGFDDQGVSCLLMARPTASRPLYTQCVGRGLRKAPGKTDCLVLDVTDNSQKHKLVTVLDLFGAPSARNADGGDVIRAADADRERAEQLHLVASVHPLTWRLKSVCPWPSLPSLKGYVPCWAWESAPATFKQTDYLRRFGLDAGRDLTKGEASYLIDRAREFEATFPLPATAKQAWRLRQLGAWRNGMTKREASQLIGRLMQTVRV